MIMLMALRILPFHSETRASTRLPALSPENSPRAVRNLSDINLHSTLSKKALGTNFPRRGAQETPCKRWPVKATFYSTLTRFRKSGLRPAKRTSILGGGVKPYEILGIESAYNRSSLSFEGKSNFLAGSFYSPAPSCPLEHHIFSWILKGNYLLLLNMHPVWRGGEMKWEQAKAQQEQSGLKARMMVGKGQRQNPSHTVGLHVMLEKEKSPCLH